MEQSGFLRILTFRVIAARYPEFGCGLLAVYLKKAFRSVLRETL